MENIKVAIVDDNQVFLQSITRYLSLSKNILLVGTAYTKEQAIMLPAMYDIDVMCMDINLTENKCDGIWAANQILTKYLTKAPKIIMLTDYNDKKIIQGSILAGAIYYMRKSEFKSLPNTIREINNNTFSMGDVMKDYCQLLKDNMLKTEFQLSNMETKIFDMAEKGNNSIKITECLSITESTYRKHVNSILKKIKAQNLRKARDKIKEIFFNQEIKKTN